MRILILALRNLTRNKRRTILTALAIVFGATAIVVLQAFVNGFIRDRVEASALAKVGAIQIFRKGYLGSDDPLQSTLPAGPALVDKLRGVPGVLAVAPRLDFDGMVSNGSESTMFMATAIDPALEYEVCPKRAINVIDGAPPLTAASEGGALLGKALAEALGARPGATLVMQAAGAKATTNALDVPVIGLLPSQHVTESKRLATVTLDFARQLLRMPEAVTEYVVRVQDLEQVERVAARIRAELGSGYDITTWREVDPTTRDRTQILRHILAFTMLVLFVLVGMGIVNTMMMSVYERVREIGTMLAVGVSRGQVLLLFLWEAASLGLVSAMIGVLGGFAIVSLAFPKGVVIQQPGGVPMTVYPGVGLGFLALLIGFTIVGTALAALHPAWKASRMRPVDALRAT